MSDFKAKMRQIVCRLELRSRPRWGSFFYSAPQTPSWIFGGILLREVRGGDPLLSRYTPIHYILDKGLADLMPIIQLCCRVCVGNLDQSERALPETRWSGKWERWAVLRRRMQDKANVVWMIHTAFVFISTATPIFATVRCSQALSRSFRRPFTSVT